MIFNQCSYKISRIFTAFTCLANAQFEHVQHSKIVDPLKNLKDKISKSKSNLNFELKTVSVNTVKKIMGKMKMKKVQGLMKSLRNVFFVVLFITFSDSTHVVPMIA